MSRERRTPHTGRLALVVLLGLGLAACGGQGSPSETASTGSTSPATRLTPISRNDTPENSATPSAPGSPAIRLPAGSPDSSRTDILPTRDSDTATSQAANPGADPGASPGQTGPVGPNTTSPSPAGNDEPADTAGTSVTATPGDANGATPGGTPLCLAELASMPPLLSGTQRQPLPDNARPPFLTSTRDPVLGSCVVRVTDNAAHPDAPSLRNDYSRRQAFNANDTRFLLAASDGHWHLHDARTGRFIRVLNHLAGATDRLAGDAEPQWHPTDPDLLHFLPRDGIGMQIYQLDLKTNQVSVVADMGPQIRQHWPDANVASTRSEGSPSADGRYWCFMARTMLDNGNWPMRGVFTWDLQEKRIIGTLDQTGTPDHVSMSPSGKYCVVSHTTATGPGTRSYRRDFQAPYNADTPTPWLQLHTTSEHSDIALDAQGRDVYVSVDYQSNGGDVFMQNLETGRRTALFSTYPGRTETALHVSGKAYARPGWVLISTYAEHPAEDSGVQGLHDDRRQWLHRKLFAVHLTADPDIRSIAYANSDAFQYEAEPQATVNRNFTRMLFNSTWNGNSIADQEVFLTAITAQALDAR